MKASHKTEIEAIRTLITALGGTCNVLSQGHKLRGSAGMPDLYVQLTRRRGDAEKTEFQGDWEPAFRKYGHEDLLQARKKAVAEDPGGIRFWVEVKAGRDTLRDDQIAFIGRERACHGDVVVGDKEAVISYLQSKGIRVQ